MPDERWQRLIASRERRSLQERMESLRSFAEARGLLPGAASDPPPAPVDLAARRREDPAFYPWPFVPCFFGCVRRGHALQPECLGISTFGTEPPFPAGTFVPRTPVSQIRPNTEQLLGHIDTLSSPVPCEDSEGSPSPWGDP